MTAGTGVLIVGYGNPLRSDDGVGWHAAETLAADPRLEGAHVLTVHQLPPELAVELGEATLAVLVDARMGEPPGSISVTHVAPVRRARRLDPSPDTGGPRRPRPRRSAGRSADVVVVSVGIESTEPGHGLSHSVADAVPAVREIVADLVLAHA